MIINYNVSGSERKRLVTAIAEHTGEKAKYLGAPGFAYQVAGFTISVEGQVTIEDNSTAAPLIRFLREKGFQAEDPLAECEAEEPTDEEATEVDSDGAMLCISMPRNLFTDTALENLNGILEAKGALIKKALGVNELPIITEDDKVSFPWFASTPAPDEIRAYDNFICKLCEMARNQKRITAKEKEVDNEKYAFRCFLLRLGFIGTEYKNDRKILLRNLTGSAAFKSTPPKKDPDLQPLPPGPSYVIPDGMDPDLAEALADAALIHQLNQEDFGGDGE